MQHGKTEARTENTARLKARGRIFESSSEEEEVAVKEPSSVGGLKKRKRGASERRAGRGKRASRVAKRVDGGVSAE